MLDGVMYIAKIQVVTILYDNQDGGYTMKAYNNEDELIADHKLAHRMTPELRQDILINHDPYENGEVSHSVIKVLVDNENVSLVEPLTFRFGQ